MATIFQVLFPLPLHPHPLSDDRRVLHHAAQRGRNKKWVRSDTEDVLRLDEPQFGLAE